MVFYTDWSGWAVGRTGTRSTLWSLGQSRFSEVGRAGLRPAVGPTPDLGNPSPDSAAPRLATPAYHAAVEGGGGCHAAALARPAPDRLPRSASLGKLEFVPTFFDKDDEET